MSGPRKTRDTGATSSTISPPSGKRIWRIPVREIPLMGATRGEAILEMRGITKRFPGVQADDHIYFDIRAGEIHTFLGENGPI